MKNIISIETSTDTYFVEKTIIENGLSKLGIGSQKTDTANVVTCYEEEYTVIFVGKNSNNVVAMRFVDWDLNDITPYLLNHYFNLIAEKVTQLNSSNYVVVTAFCLCNECIELNVSNNTVCDDVYYNSTENNTDEVDENLIHKMVNEIFLENDTYNPDLTIEFGE